MIRLVVVPHGAKVGKVKGLPGEIASNPPMTIEGMVKLLATVKSWHSDSNILPLRPYTLYSSRMARALCTASVIANVFDLDISTMEGLGQMANKDDDGVIYYYPGHEEDDFVVWQQQAIDILSDVVMNHLAGDVVFIVCHRPILAGMLAYSRGIYGPERAAEVEALAGLKDLAGPFGFVQFDLDSEDLSGKLTELPR